MTVDPTTRATHMPFTLLKITLCLIVMVTFDTAMTITPVVWPSSKGGPKSWSGSTLLVPIVFPVTLWLSWSKQGVAD